MCRRVHRCLSVAHRWKRQNHEKPAGGSIHAIFWAPVAANRRSNRHLPAHRTPCSPLCLPGALFFGGGGVAFGSFLKFWEISKKIQTFRKEIPKHFQKGSVTDSEREGLFSSRAENPATRHMNSQTVWWCASSPFALCPKCTECEGSRSGPCPRNRCRRCHRIDSEQRAVLWRVGAGVWGPPLRRRRRQYVLPAV